MKQTHKCTPAVVYVQKRHKCEEQKSVCEDLKESFTRKSRYTAITHFHPNGKSSEVLSRASERNSVVLNNGIIWGL